MRIVFRGRRSLADIKKDLINASKDLVLAKLNLKDQIGRTSLLTALKMLN